MKRELLFIILSCCYLSGFAAALGRGQTPPPPVFTGGNAGGWLPGGSLFDPDRPFGNDLPGFGENGGEIGYYYSRPSDIPEDDDSGDGGGSTACSCQTSGCSECRRINLTKCRQGKPDYCEYTCFCTYDEPGEVVGPRPGHCRHRGGLVGSGSHNVGCCQGGDPCIFDNGAR
jgi:hypothetical protein